MSNGDPVGAHEPRGKSNTKRMGRYDGSWTPTERRQRDELMKQFCRDEGPPPSEAYLNAPCWCACGRLKSIGDLCLRCADATSLGEHPLSESVTVTYASGKVTYVSDPRMEGRPPMLLQLDDWNSAGLKAFGGTTPEPFKP